MRLSLKTLVPALERGFERMRMICAYTDCPNQNILRCIPQTRVGIRVDNQWYCGADCLAAGARSTLAALASERVARMPRAPRLPLGLVLLSKGILNDEQLRAAAAHCRWSGEELDAALLRQGQVTEKQLTAARAVQWGCLGLAPEHTGRMVEIDLPRSILESCEAVPLHYSATGKRVLLGFVRRPDHGLLGAIERMTGCRAEPCFISSAEFSEQMERITFVPDYEESVVNDPGGLAPERMARTVARYAVRVAATAAAFTRCHDSIWARVSGKRGIADVVFYVREAGRTQSEIADYMESAAEAVAG